MIERAATMTDPAATLEQRLHTVPPRILAAINRNRTRAGLRPLGYSPPPPPAAPAFRWDERSPWRPGAIRTTVLLVAHHGLARGTLIGRTHDERIAQRAFGTAEQLNRSPGWFLRSGHDDLPITFAGPRLRAVDSLVGLVVEWTPDLSNRRHIELVDAVERGELFPSVAFTGSVRQSMRLPQLCECVTAGTLQHIGLVPRGAYPGAVARVFRNVPSTPDNKRRQLDAVVQLAMQRANRQG